MEQKTNISIAVTKFSYSPGPRYCNQGEASGEAFYHEVLNKAFNEAVDKNVEFDVILDGADGYASSFLDEAIGNLVYDFGEKLVKDKLKVITNEEPEWETMLWKSTIPQWEKRRKEGKAPKVTKSHPEWTRINKQGILEEGVWEDVE